MPKKPTSTQTIDLSPEARALQGQELELFAQSFVPADIQARQNALQGLGRGLRQTPESQGTTQAINLARAMTRTAGQQEHLPTTLLTPELATIGEQQPLLQSDLQNLFRGMAQQQSTMIDPRWAQFLRPDLGMANDPGWGSTAATAASLTLAAAGVAAAII